MSWFRLVLLENGGKNKINCLLLNKGLDQELSVVVEVEKYSEEQKKF